MKERNYALDFQKLIFSLVIVLFHANGMIADKYVFKCGNLAVEFFFIISGAFMAASYSKAVKKQPLCIEEETFVFIKKKLIRLFPNLYVAYVVSVILHIICKDFYGIKDFIERILRSIPELLLIGQFGFKNQEFIGSTWYISTMLFSMLIIYPIMLKYKDNFFYIIAPFFCLLILGMMYKNLGGVGGVSKWIGFTFKSNIRGFADLLLGCTCWKIAEYLKKIKFTEFARICFFAVEWGLLIIIILFMIGHFSSGWDYLLLLMFAVSSIISLSNCSIDGRIFNNRFYKWIGEYSFNLYISHGCFVKLHKKMFYHSIITNEAIIIYLLMAIVNGLFIMYFSKFICFAWNTYSARIKKIFIV